MLRRLVGTTTPGHDDCSIQELKKLVIMALYRSPLTVTLWPSSFLKKYGPMIPPAHKATLKKLCPSPSPFFVTERQVESEAEPDESGKEIEEVVDLARQENLEVDTETFQELLNSHIQELRIDELIEMHEQDVEELYSLESLRS
ncbi:hypothetical protein TNCV_1851881 [Trichonephila clavipes]|nr:hypothetical protein TNCV_1851881 [Trichonephila clavipes]